MFLVANGDKLLLNEEDLLMGENPYFYDKDGSEIDMMSGADLNRMRVSLQDMPQLLPKAFIAIEDERFESHSGVDVKRTLGAVLTYAVNRGNSDFGGSTITQQLVKNITGEDEDVGVGGITRKVKEWVRATQLENMLSKGQILELYLNILFLGGNVSGVQTASHYYFDKDVKDLTIAECAFLAGITHQPNAYDPYKEGGNKEKIDGRVETVLDKMKELGHINDEQYAEANAQELVFKKGENVSKKFYSYFIEEAAKQVISDLAKEKNISEQMATTMFYTGGYKVYTTQETRVQNRMEEVYKMETDYNGNSLFITSDESGQVAQSAMVMIDYKNGYVVGIIGGRGEKDGGLLLNRATQSKRPVGSSMKPIGVYGPALETGTITAGTIIDNIKTTFDGGWTPYNVSRDWPGYTTIRQAITDSQNVTAAKVLSMMGTEKSYEFLQNMGVVSLTEEDKYSLSSLSLGGNSVGITPLEMSAAYGTIANDGEYISPTFYTKVVDSKGKVVLEAKQKRKRVFSVQNAYIMKDLLTGPVQSGTAWNLAMSGMDVAAKTGSTDDWKDRWMCGFTPYYVAATWYGFDEQEYLGGGTNKAGLLLQYVWDNIHADLPGARFERPEGIIYGSVCRDSGLALGEFCSQDPRGSRIMSEIFVSGTVPTKTCDIHIKAEVCAGTGLLANEHCPNKTSKICITRPNEKGNIWQEAYDAAFMAPTKKCETHTKPATPVTPVTPVIPKPNDNTIENDIINDTIDDNDDDDDTNITTP